ncbi:MAG: acyltransferase family protein [Janthinobacterium lividum]
MQARSKPTLIGIQYLRGFAALAVVFYHVFSNRVAQDWSSYRNFGIVGVDVFFIISGFIMWRTTSREAIPDPLSFLLRRATRIYPAWWIALTIWIVMRFVVPDRLHNADVNMWSVITSYALAPYYHSIFQGHVWPILVPGWTLELEILFYLLFAGTLWITSGPIRLVIIMTVLIGLSIAGVLHGVVNAFLEDLTSPLMLEFAAGIIVATQFSRLRALPSIVSAALLIVGVCLVGAFANLVTDDASGRALTLGSGATLIVAGVIGLENRLRTAPMWGLLILGDASYSLYLTHPISISMAAFVWERLHLPTASSPVAVFFVPLAMIVAVAVALLFYWLIEIPLLERLTPSLRHRFSDVATDPGRQVRQTSS